MIDLYYWPTPNGHKITIFLEESGLDYKVKPVNLTQGAQFAEDFLKISPNNKIPAIVDHDPADGGDPVVLFESGAILEYLAEKTGKFLPTDLRARYEVKKWLYWQVAGLGPMAGQAHHFNIYAPEQVPYAVKRYTTEVNRLYHVLDIQLEGRDYIAGDYSIADMACHPWIAFYAMQKQDINEFPNIKAWFDRIRLREAVQSAYDLTDRMSM